MCRHPSRASRLVAPLLLLIAACSAHTASETEAESAAVEGNPQGLAFGDRGPEVRFVHDYLSRYGYFPSDALASRYPDWRPLLAEAPVEPDAFDETLERGVMGFQQMAGLPATGVVDAATRAEMQAPRCSHPESFPRQDEKFLLSYNQHGAGKCARKFVGDRWEITVSTGETDTAFRNTFQRALDEWSRLASVRFRWVSSGGCIHYEGHRPLRVGDCRETDPSVLAFNCPDTRPPSSLVYGNNIVVGSQQTDGSAINWSFTTPAEANRPSLWLVMLHEIGHALGLAHSSHRAMWGETPVMFFKAANGDRKNALTDDDALAAHFIWTTQFKHLRTDDTFISTTSLDVTLAGDIWSVDTRAGNSDPASGFALWCNGNRVDGWASFVAADYNRAYHTNQRGEVYRSAAGGCGTNWQQMASDSTLSFIAANNDAKVWALSKDVKRNLQERHIYRFFNGRFRRVDGFAIRIAVDTHGVPWHINQARELYRWDETLPGCSLANAPDLNLRCWRKHSTGWLNVHGGKNSFVWVLTTSAKQIGVLNTNMMSGNTFCITPSSSCVPVEQIEYFPFQNQIDAVSDGFSRVFMQEGLIPTDGGPPFGAGMMYSIF